MTYACVIHVCLDVALREGDLRPSVIESKNAKPNVRVYYMCPREQDPLRQPRWHQFPSALAASASCGTSFGLL